MELSLHVILQKPPADIVFGLQKGSGTNYEIIQVQESTDGDLHFNFTIGVKGNKQKDELPDFNGPFAQGPRLGRFIYLNIGSYAGQADFHGGRIKIPLTGISWSMVHQLESDSRLCLETIVPGTAKNGGPAYATVKPFDGWKVRH